jgi:hypothetical protein
MSAAARDRVKYFTCRPSPLANPSESRATGLDRMHGNDERLSVDNVGYGVHSLYDILRYAP